MGKKNFDNLVDNVIGSDGINGSVKQQTPSPTPSPIEVPSSEPTGNSEQGETVTNEKPQRGRPTKNVDAVENFCGRADSIKLAKIRAVAEKENVPIKDLYNLAFDLFITAYEEKNGKIRIKPKQTKGDVSSLI